MFPRVDVEELIDRDDQPREEYLASMRNIAALNRAFRGYAGILRMLRRLEPRWPEGGLEFADVGVGIGDIPRLIADWCRARELTVRIRGIDRNPDVIDAARAELVDYPEVTFEQRDILRSPLPPDSCDVVLCSQFLHHFDPEEIRGLLEQFDRAARVGVVAADLERHPVACYGVALWCRLFLRNRISTHDAPASVRRSYTVAEWRDIVEGVPSRHEPWRVEGQFPWRVLVSNTEEHRRDACATSSGQTEQP